MSDELPDLDRWRAAARDWLAANLPRRGHDAARGLRGVDHKTRESIAPEREKQRRLHEAGYAGLTWPRQYGGQGLPPAYQRAFDEEAAGYLMPDFGVAGGTTFGVCARTMLAHASPEFLERHIPGILRGDELFVQFFSEPGAGSDLAGVTTRAERDGDNWIVNGAKIWSSGAYYADWGMCLARTNWDVPKHRGLTWFAVRIDAPGVTVREIREINGDTEFCEEFFDDVVVPDADRISEVDEGWRVAQTMLVFERGGGGEGTAGAAPPPTSARRLAPDLVAAAERAGRRQDPYARQLIARAHINDAVAAPMARRIAAIIRTGKDPAGVAGYGKLMQGWYGALRAQTGIELGRGAVLTWEDGDLTAQEPALNYLNGRAMAIAGGTNEMQRNGIGERVLGLPREPSFDSGKPFRDVVRDARHWDGKVG